MQHCLRPEVQLQPQNKYVPNPPQGFLHFDVIVEYADRVLTDHCS